LRAEEAGGLGGEAGAAREVASQSCALSKMRGHRSAEELKMAYLKDLKVTFTRRQMDDDLINKPAQSPE